MENSEFPREITLCLSGGAARGAYHLGVLSVLEEQDIVVKAISGTSIGALIGASLACGKSAKEIFDVLKSQEFKRVFKLSLGKGYIFRLNHNAAVVDKLINVKAFEDLSIPLSICACDVQEESALYFDKGAELKELVLASCSIAPLFQPVRFYSKTLVDGGVVDNFPVEQLKKHDYPILGINLHPKQKKIPKSILGWFKKIIHTAWQSHYYQKSELCDIYLCNEKLNDVKIFSFKDLDKAYALGVEDMRELLC